MTRHRHPPRQAAGHGDRAEGRPDDAVGRFGAEGRPPAPEGCGGALQQMLDHLTWWARALRDARVMRPFGERRTAPRPA